MLLARLRFAGSVCFLLLLIAAAAAPTAAAQGSVVLQGEWKTGEELYESACASCHGVDGRGQPRGQVGFEVPLPDFTDCSFVTREPDTDWSTITHWGGPARAFDKLMPAFGEALTGPEIQRSLDHIRRFCTDDSWPRGELNFPRALVTEKAFPEDEAVISVGVTTESPVEVSGKIVFETRFGALNQFELIVPFGLAEPGDDAVGGDSLREGIGDVALGVKRVLVHSLETGTIFAAAGEVILPTGDEADGYGKGTLIVEPFLSAGQLIPAVGFVQLQAGVGLPIDPDRAAREVFGRIAAGRSFRLGRFKRPITPMVELLTVRELKSGAAFEWDLVPQVQVALSTRQHVLWCVGVQVPLTEPDSRALEIMTGKAERSSPICRCATRRRRWLSWLRTACPAPCATRSKTRDSAAKRASPVASSSTHSKRRTSARCSARSRWTRGMPASCARQCSSSPRSRSTSSVPRSARRATPCSRSRSEKAARSSAGCRNRCPIPRVWLHVRVLDATGAVFFESGALRPNGAISGNDNDEQDVAYEPHYDVIQSADQVQIYEAIMATPDGKVTTGLLSATQFIKDNRLLPAGFDKATAEPDISVRGSASADVSFAAGVDRVSYDLPIGDRPAPYEVRIALRYQPIAYRWAQNLKGYAAAEPQRFVRYYESMAAGSSALLGETTVRVALPAEHP